MSELHRIGGDRAGRKADVVFVHGLGGDWSGTWRYGVGDETSWPHWVAEEFPEVGVWSLEYAASPSMWSKWSPWATRDAGQTMALPDRALQVLELMAQRGFGERPLLFICHSLGGLVVKEILRASAESLEAEKKVFLQTRGVLFLATPHAGSDLASLASKFRTVFGSTVSMNDLRAHDAHLRSLSNWYRNHSSEPEIRTVTYFETRTVRGVTIVNSTSAHPGVGVDPVALDEDHLSITKPRYRDAQVCGAARALLQDYVLVGRHARKAIATGVQQRLVPHELPPVTEKFVGRKAEVGWLVERLKAGKNTAVVGAAGVGKTALAARALIEVAGRTGKTLRESPFPDGIVYLDLYTLQGLAEQVWETLANRLMGASDLATLPAENRATQACLGRQMLLVVEGGEEANGLDGRTSFSDIRRVLPAQACWLLLTRLGTQADEADSIVLSRALTDVDAGRLFDSLTDGRLPDEVRAQALKLSEGHPLGLTLAADLLGQEAEDPEMLLRDWEAWRGLNVRASLETQHRVQWLYQRKEKSLELNAARALAAAGLLANVPFTTLAISAALEGAYPNAETAASAALNDLAHGSFLRRISEDHWQFTHVVGYHSARREIGSDEQMRRRMSVWLQQELAGGLAGGGSSSADNIEHLVALLRSDDSHILSQLVDYVYNDFTQRLLGLGRLGQVGFVFSAIGAWLSTLPPDQTGMGLQLTAGDGANKRSFAATAQTPGGNGLLEETIELRNGDESDTDRQPVLRFRRAPQKKISTVKRKAFVSYAWGDQSSEEGRQRTAVVEGLCAQVTKEGWTVFRDIDAMKPGDQISKFMRRLSRADLVIIVLSEKYLHSIPCMTELHGVYDYSRTKKEFNRRIIPLVLADAKISTPEDRIEVAKHWSDRYEKLDLNRHHLGGDDLQRWILMKKWHDSIGDILSHVSDVIHPHGFEQIVQDNFSLLREMLQRKQITAGKANFLTS